MAHPGFKKTVSTTALVIVWGFYLTVYRDQDAAGQSVQRVLSESAQVERIDQLIAEVWNDYQIKPSGPAREEEWCRRLFLDVIGRIPTVDELDTFVSNRDSNKRHQLVSDLLYSDRYTHEFARNWTTLWTNLLIGRTGGNDNNSLVSRAGLQKYLRDSFARKKPMDDIAVELITASGTTTPGAEQFNGATNFLIDKVNDDNASLATATTSRLFMGLQIQCAQCHNHPFNDWKQQNYWEMNAFFRQVRGFRGGLRRMDTGPAQLVDQDFSGEAESGNFDKPPIFYDLRDGQVRVAYPVFIDGTQIDPSGYVKAVNRREQLADLIVKSRYFPETMVNRIWSHFLGYGFTLPVDDMGPHNPPSHPELLRYLAEEFRDQRYDLRALISWIVLSEPYSLSSIIGKSNASDDPLLGESPKFSRFYLRQVRAEELYESLLVANSGSMTTVDFEQQEQLKNRWLQQFSQTFGTDEGDETTTFNGTIPQVLMMFNGELIRAATGDAQGSMIRSLSNSNRDYSKKIEYLFKAGLSRWPTRREAKMADDLLRHYSGQSDEAIRDLWWAILNSNEFIFNH